MNVTRHAANMAAKVRDVVMEAMVCVMKSACDVAADASTEHVHEEVSQFSEVLKKMETARCALMSEWWSYKVGWCIGGDVACVDVGCAWCVCVCVRASVCTYVQYVACACFTVHTYVCVCVVLSVSVPFCVHMLCCLCLTGC